MNLTTILVAAALFVAADLLGWWVIVRRRGGATPTSGAAPTAEAGAPPPPLTLGTRTGARIINCRPVPSSAAERGTALVDLRLEVGGESGMVVRTTWDVDLHALGHLQQDAVVAVEVQAHPTLTVQPAVPWARAWPPAGTPGRRGRARTP